LIQRGKDFLQSDKVCSRWLVNVENQENETITIAGSETLLWRPHIPAYEGMRDIRTKLSHRGPELIPDPAVDIEVMVFIRACPVHRSHECEIVVKMCMHGPIQESSDLRKNRAWSLYKVLEYGDLTRMDVLISGYRT
jgi:hypothetical protein